MSLPGTGLARRLGEREVGHPLTISHGVSCISSASRRGMEHEEVNWKLRWMELHVMLLVMCDSSRWLSVTWFSVLVVP